MAARWDSQKQQWVFDDEPSASTAVMAPPQGLDYAGEVAWANQQQQKDELRAAEMAVQQGGDQRPVMAENAGQFFGDLGKIAANAVVGLGTDFLDLGAGVADVVRQTGSLMATGEFDPNVDVFDDSDNPWTQWRRETFRTETQAGQAVSNLVRLGTMVTTLPKLAISVPAKALGVAGKVKVLGGVADVATGASNWLTKLDDLANAKKATTAATALGQVEKTFQKGTAAQRAASRAIRNDWLTLTYQDVAKSVPEVGGWMDDVRQSAKAWTQLSKGTPGARIRTVGQALAWDAFAAFNVYGEGDAEFDETFGDLLSSTGVSWLQSLGNTTATYAEDNALTRKAKQMLEGLVMAPVLNGIIDQYRVYKYAKNFRTAGDGERRLIVEALNANSQEIGDSIGRTLVAQGRVAGVRLPGSMSDLEFQVDQARRSQEAKNQFLQDMQQAQVRQVQTEPGGAMVPFDQRPMPPTEGVPADMASPVQNRLAQMEGLASQLNEDPLYQQWLMEKAPAEQFMPPQAGDNPALQQFAAQGAMPAPSTQGGPDDLQAYKAWLEEKARLPDAELNPQVQQSLRRLEGIGELAPVRPGPQGMAQFPAAAAVEPAQIVDLGPRPPEATVTPQTIRSAFERDAYKAFMEAQELTFEEGPDGIMRSMAELQQQVRRLMPRTRVDALEYLNNFRPAANKYGVVPASDSVWMNFLYERGLNEGWASIDPDTMGVRFNRKAAADLDRGDLVIDQASKIDEAIRYEEWLWNKELVNGNPQMRPEVQDNLAAKEARDAYDNWEAQQAALPPELKVDQATVAAQEEAIRADQNLNQFDAAEELRLSAADAQGLQGLMDDQTVVREMLGTTLDTVPVPEVRKAEIGRGWEVFDENGELIGRTTTKRQADQLAQQQLQQNRDALLARARQMEADATDEMMNVTIGNPVYDSDIVGKVKLTDAQIKAVQGILPSLDSKLDEAWKMRRGESAFFNINELGPQKRTFELSQGDMFALQNGIRDVLKEAGDIKGSPKLRALRNLADKLDTEMKLLEPQARAQRFVDGLVNDTRTTLDNGGLHCEDL